MTVHVDTMQPHLNMQPGKAFLLFFGCFYTIVVLNQSCYTPRFAMADIYLSMSPQTSQASWNTRAFN